MNDVNQLRGSYIVMRKSLITIDSSLVELTERNVPSAQDKANVHIAEYQDMLLKNAPGMFQEALVTLLDRKRLFAEMAVKIKERDKSLEDYFYYVEKVNGLQTDKGKRSQMGKEETKSEIEKLQRNEDKLRESQTTFEAAHLSLVQSIAEFQGSAISTYKDVAQILWTEQRLSAKKLHDYVGWTIRNGFRFKTQVQTVEIVDDSQETQGNIQEKHPRKHSIDHSIERQEIIQSANQYASQES